MTLWKNMQEASESYGVWEWDDRIDDGRGEGER